MSKYHSDVFTPKNPTKYVGTFPIVYRSAWELTFMNVCDQHPNILQWASESLQIPYQNPVTGRWHRYIPDFLILYQDKEGKRHGELIEIKPISQTLIEKAKTKRDKEAIIINTAKWKAAEAFCVSRGLKFRVMTEYDLYGGKRKAT
jgi:TnsA endonuclease N terminal